MRLIPIIYHNLPYPSHITPTIREVSSHFDVSKLDDSLKDYEFSLHTEYSATKRNFKSDLIQQYPNILKSQSNSERSKPKLWINDEWMTEFSDFICSLLNGKTPEIIEIHPPNSRKFDVEKCLDYYERFRDYLLEREIDYI
jgi:hypothetical protein